MSTLKATFLQQAASTNPNITLDSSANATVGGTLVMGSSFLRNRIINGDMRIDQRNAGAVYSGVANNTYTLDRWNASVSQSGKISIQQNANSVTPPSGFTNYLGVTVAAAVSLGASDYFMLQQKIEGFNSADFAFGLSSAQTVTLSFYVYSNLTGTFGGVLTNSASNRFYPFSYSISSANTWQKVSIAITGDITGTWLTNNGTGVQLWLCVGAGSTYLGTANSWSGTTYVGPTGQTNLLSSTSNYLYITGVQLEVGSVATPFERRQYGTELMLCQRYLPAYNSSGVLATVAPSYAANTTAVVAQFTFPAQTRVAPTGITVSSASHLTYASSAASVASSAAFNAASVYVGTIQLVVSGATTNSGGTTFFNNASGQLLFTGCEL